jgi:ribonuclease R
MEGVITGVERFGLFVTGKEIPAEGFIHISALADDFYRFERATHSITGYQAGNTFRLGDTLKVAVVSVDVDSRELDFRVLGHASRGKTAKPGRPGTKLKGKRDSKGANGSRGPKGSKGPKGEGGPKGGKKRRKR